MPVGRILANKYRIAMLSIFLIGLVIRLLLAPFSTGSDIPQFAGFADTFREHGLCFYKYSDPSDYKLKGWPYPWPYVYGPIWILILGFLRVFADDPVRYFWVNGLYKVYAPVSWIIAVKSLLILFDTISALLIYKLVYEYTRKQKFSILALILYYMNPCTIYITSIYGMFDQVALAFFLAALYLYMRNKALSSGVLAGVSFITKQTLAPSVIFLTILVFKTRSSMLKRFVIGLVLPILLLVGPFMACPGSITGLLSSLKQAGSPFYTLPIQYSFNGVSSLATYLWKHQGMDLLLLIRLWIIPAALLSAILLYVALTRKPLGLFTMVLSPLLVFATTYWRVNYQYLLPLVGLLVLALAESLGNNALKFLKTMLILFIGLWPIFFPTSWWFHVHIASPNTELIKIIDSITLMIFDERFYVAYSMILTLLEYSLIILIISRWWAQKDVCQH